MKVVKFKMALDGMDAAEMIWHITKPCEVIRAHSYHTTIQKVTGWSGGTTTYRDKPCVKCSVKWDISSAEVMDIPEATLSAVYYAHNLDKCEVFFVPSVAVGDLIVPVEGNVGNQLARGFVCGEGTQWAVVYCNDGEHSPDNSSIPNIGHIYALATAKAAGLGWAKDIELPAA